MLAFCCITKIDKTLKIEIHLSGEVHTSRYKQIGKLRFHYRIGKVRIPVHIPAKDIRHIGEYNAVLRTKRVLVEKYIVVDGRDTSTSLSARRKRPVEAVVPSSAVANPVKVGDCILKCPVDVVS